MDLDKELDLLDEFPPPSYEQWRRLVEESLKGADFDKAMFTNTYEGIRLKPIYRKEDLESLTWLNSSPGQAPYVRGSDPQRFLADAWLVAQSYDEPDLKTLNKQLLADLNNGLTAITLQLKNDDHPRGVSLKTLEDMKAAFAGVDLSIAPLFAQLDIDDHGFLPLLEEYLRSQGKDLGNIKAGVGFDVSSELARKGYLSQGLEETWGLLLQSFKWAVEKAPGVRVLSLAGSVYENAGASSAQELGFLLSTAVGYIQGLQQSGYTIDQIAPRFQAQLSLGSNLFMEIAKVRAFRLLWSELIKAFGGNEESQKIWIHGRTASFNKSRLDIYVNLLRSTTEGFAGVIGGVDSLQIEPFNNLLLKDDDTARRLARNQQLILKEEAHLDKVIDPAGGCYYIEYLTGELADRVWKLMQELEAGQGMIKALQAGKVHAMIAEVANARISAARTRKDVYVGANMYANPLEEVNYKNTEAAHVNNNPAVALEAGALPKLRVTTAFEDLRQRIANTLANKKVFLLNMGSLSEYKARSDFATGFFQVGGLEVISPSGFTQAQDAAEAALASGASAFCICSTDDNYSTLVPEICSRLQGRPMILAGYPKDMVETYKQQGINLFIHVKADVVSVLSQLTELMEVVK